MRAILPKGRLVRRGERTACTVAVPPVDPAAGIASLEPAGTPCLLRARFARRMRSGACRLRSRAQLRRFDAVDADSLAFELDHRDPFAIGALELRDPGDVDLVDLEAELGLQAPEVGARELAEMAVAGDVERQPHLRVEPADDARLRD